MTDIRYLETPTSKHVRSADYNFDFDKETGFFARWGTTPEDDPVMSPIGPEIADIEVTTSCSGPAGKVCSFCYKSNTPKGEHMSLDTFKTVFAKLPKTLTQIAFGADANATANPDLFPIMEYTRANGVIPNITVANVTEEIAAKLAAVCGAVAVSRYADKNWCYDSIERLTRNGLKQVNIHQLVSAETFDQAKETILDAKTDPRLAGLKAIVFLSLKPKGRGVNYGRLDEARFKELVDLAFSTGVQVGMDSCSAPKLTEAVKDRPDFKQMEACIEPCESSLYSLFCNVKGQFSPCSFSEGKDFGDAGGWREGIDLTKVEDFMSEVWHAPMTEKFRKALLANKDGNGIRACPLYEI